MDEKEQKVTELLENLSKLVPTLLVIGQTADGGGVLVTSSPEKDVEKRRLDLGATIAAMMRVNQGLRNVVLSAVCLFIQKHPEYQTRMYEALAKMKQKPLPVPAGEA